MSLITRDPEILDLVRRALSKAELHPSQVLQAWNARIVESKGVVVMESGAEVFLDWILKALRVYLGDEPLPHEWRYLPVHIREVSTRYPSQFETALRTMSAGITREGGEVICGRCKANGIKTADDLFSHLSKCVDRRWAKVARLHRLGHHDRASRVARRLLGIKGPPMPQEVKDMLRARRRQRA